MILSELEIARWIEGGESDRLDFKHQISSSQKIAKSISAFANTHGGSLLIGIKDNGRPVGISVDEEEHMVAGANDLHCTPKAKIMYFPQKYLGKTILEARILPSETEKIKAKDDDGAFKYFIRIQDKTVQASAVIVQSWRFHRQELAITDHDIAFLKNWESSEPKTVSKLSRETRIGRNNIVKKIAKLVTLRLVDWNYHNDTFYFYPAVEEEAEID